MVPILQLKIATLRERIPVMVQLGGELKLSKAHIINLYANISQSVVWELQKGMPKTLSRDL